MNNKSFSYKVNGKPVQLKVDTDYVALKFNSPLPKSARSNFVNANNHLGEFSKRTELPGEEFTIFKLAEIQIERVKRFDSAFKSLTKSNEITKAVPVFKSGNKQIVATDKIIVGFDPEAKNIDDIIQKYNCQILENSYGSYLLKTPEEIDLFKLVNDIENENGVQYAEPNFITITSSSANISQFHVKPQDPNFDDNTDLSAMQYALKLTNAIKAWEIQRGNKEIKIAILDEGIELSHPDFDHIIEKSYDAIDNDEFQEPNDWDGHGTACCGLAAAKHKSFGIKGLSAGCSIYAVRIAQSLAPRGSWSTDNFTIKRAIDWTWENGADIISNSWGGGAPSNDIISAFERARIKGRKGKGCIIVVAAGNENSEVTFPGNLPEVLTVSASNEYDEPKTLTSKDGENWWGSCYGPEIDVAAPGVHNLTTDISGSKGYNVNSNYTDFNGTSSATPIVAGIAGLILSFKPELTEFQVRSILKNTADKVGNVTYYEGHNDRMGFGRVNAFKALMSLSMKISPLKSKKATPRKK